MSLKIGNVQQLNDFIATVNECKGQVWLESQEGDRFNLKSIFSQYIAYGRLLSERGDALELFCSESADEDLFYRYFDRHQEVIAGE